MKTYDSSDLKDDRWLRKREKILEYADHRCQACGVEQVSLQVHHSYYRDGLRAWEYPDGSLIALCSDCHGRVIHGIESQPIRNIEIKPLNILDLDLLKFAEEITQRKPTPCWDDIISECSKTFAISRRNSERKISQLIRCGVLWRIGPSGWCFNSASYDNNGRLYGAI